MGLDIVQRYTCDTCRRTYETASDTNGLYAQRPDHWRMVSWRDGEHYTEGLYCSIECEYRKYQEIRDDALDR